MPTEAEAREMGRTAFTDGLSRIVPRDLIERSNLGVARAWYAGWDRANLDAPWEEVD